MAVTNHERVGKGLDLLRAGLAPFIEREFASVYRNEALAQARRFLGEDRLLAGKALAEWDVAALLATLDAQAEVARERCYRLYTLCERKKRAQEALWYNALVQRWPEVARLAREGGTRRAEQTTMFGGDEA